MAIPIPADVSLVRPAVPKVCASCTKPTRTISDNTQYKDDWLYSMLPETTHNDFCYTCPHRTTILPNLRALLRYFTGRSWLLRPCACAFTVTERDPSADYRARFAVPCWPKGCCHSGMPSLHSAKSLERPNMLVVSLEATNT